MKNPYRYVDFWASIAPERIAVADERFHLTYENLRKFIPRAAYVLKNRGVKAGDLIALTLPSIYGYVFQIVANSMGASVMSKLDLNPFPPRIKPDFLLSNSQNPYFPSTETILVNQELFDQISRSPEIDRLDGFRNDDALCSLFGTSGTTGGTKYLEVTVDTFRQRTLEPGSDVYHGQGAVYMLLPFGALWATQHAFRGLVFGKTYFTFYNTDEQRMAIFGKFPIETIIGSPAQVSKLLDDADKLGIDLNSIQSFIVGGDSPTAQLLKRIREKSTNCKIINNYGSTEVGGIAHSDVTHGIVDELILRPWMEVEVVDEGDQPLDCGKDGAIRAKSPHMGRRYFQDQEATKKSFKEGYHYPGDLGRLMENGRLFITGRTDNVLHLSGVKANPEIIEKLVETFPGVKQCIATEVVNMDSGVKELGLAIETTPEFKPNELAPWLQGKELAPVLVYLNSKLPRTATGKVMRGVLSDRLMNQEPWLKVMTN